MNLWLDDLRNPEKFGFYDAVWVKTYHEFVKYLTMHEMPKLISFDNDLGTRIEGYDCAKWLVGYCMENNIPLPNWQVHSANPVARKNIETLLTNYKKHMENPLVTFGKAIEALKEGKTIYRQCWAGTKLRMIPEVGESDPFIMADLWNGRHVSWIPTHDDMLNDDWLVE